MRLLPAKASRIAFRMSFTGCLAVFIGNALPALAQEVAGSATAIVQKTAFEMIWSVARTPPYVFFVLVACSILTVTLIIERFMYYRGATGNAEELIRKIKQAGSLSEALTAVEHAPGVVAEVIRTTIQATRDGCPPDHIEGLAQSAAT